MRTTLALILAGAAASAQVFPSPQFLSDVSNLGQLALGDVDGDGDVDVIATTNIALGNDVLVVLLSDGAGAFSVASSTAANVNLRDIALRDLDGDGALDIVTASDGGAVNAIGVRLGAGDGSFGPVANFAMAVEPFDLLLDDLDGDGVLDAVTPSGTGVRISVRLGNGDGSFAERSDVLVGSEPGHVASGDVDGDGIVDLAVSNAGSDTISILLGDGEGGFASAPAVPTFTGPADVALLDVDGDGLLDLVYGTLAGPALDVRLGVGDGTFGVTSVVLIDGPGEELIATDVDEDGRDDLVVLSGQLSVRAFVAGAGLVPSARLGLPGSAGDVAVGDMTGDGDLDIVSGGGIGFGFGSTLSVLEGDGRGAFRAAYRGTDGCSDVAFGDVDGDGRVDMVLANEFADDVQVFPGVGNGFFGAPTAFDVSDNPSSLGLADLDGNGALDIVLAHDGSTSSVDLWFGDGDGAFGGPVSLTPVGLPTFALPVDVDGDGDVDIASISPTSLVVNLFVNDGAGVFSAPDLLATAPGPIDVAAGDMTGDGLVDLVVCTDQNSSVVLVYRNLGGGAFDGALSFPASGAGRALDLADLDADGDLDVVVANADAVGELALLYNDGAGFLSGAVTLDGPGVAEGVVADDFDGDGIVDLAAAHTASTISPLLDAATLRLGLGGGVYAPPEEYGVTSFPRRLRAADVDGDGALDLALPGFSDEVELLINTGGAWTDLGFALAGTQGLPKQVGEGTLADDAAFAFTLSDARPGGTASHVVGLSTVFAPFKGGVFVPTPTLINAGLPLDASGDLVLSGSWPAGAGGISLFLQFWIPDPTGPKGFAASNAIQATIP